MEAQFQIRQNAMEAQDFMQDLLSWQHTLKEKSGKSKQQATNASSVPAVRGRAPGSVSTAPEALHWPSNPPSSPAQSATAATAHPAAHTYSNYSKWEKFDVDTALQDEGAAAKPAPQLPKAASVAAGKQASGQAQRQQLNGTSSGSSAETRVAQPPPPTAAALKDRGNKLYQAGYYGDAISCYTQSIDLQPTSIAYANRAMAQLRLNNFQAAEQDCTAALQLDPTYVKALHRRGTARKQLGKLLDAAVDFEEALRLEPANKTLSADRDDAVQQYLQHQKIPFSSRWSSISIQQQQQHQQPAFAEQQQPAQSAIAALGTQMAATVNSAPTSRQAASKSLDGQRAEMTAAAPTAATAAAGPVAGKRGSSPVHARPAAAADVSHDSKRGAISNSTVAAEPSKPLSNGTAAAAAAAAAATSPPRLGTSTSAAAEAAAAQLAARLAAGLKPPRTSNDFEAAWRSFKGDQGLQAKYLQLMSPQQLPVVFKTSLTAPMLTAVLTVAINAIASPAAAEDREGKSLDAAHALALIEHMVKVPRFDMTAMCLTSRDKASLKQLWDAAEAACEVGARSILEGLRAKYRLR